MYVCTELLHSYTRPFTIVYHYKMHAPLMSRGFRQLSVIYPMQSFVFHCCLMGSVMEFKGCCLLEDHHHRDKKLHMREFLSIGINEDRIGETKVSALRSDTNGSELFLHNYGFVYKNCRIIHTFVLDKVRERVR